MKTTEKQETRKNDVECKRVGRDNMTEDEREEERRKPRKG